MGIFLEGRQITKLYMGKKEIYDVNDEVVKEKKIIEDGLILHYDFSTKTNDDENKEIIEDLSGNGNDGILSNFNFTEDSGYTGKGLRFDGLDDEINFENIEFRTGQDFTVELLMSNRKSDYRNYSRVFGDGRSGSINTGTYFYYSSYPSFYRGGMSRSSMYTYYSTLQEYSFTSVTSNNRDINFLHNLESSLSSSAILEDDEAISAFNNIGKVFSNSSFQHQGDIHAVRIYDRALSQKELEYNHELDKEKYLGIEPPKKIKTTSKIKFGDKKINRVMREGRAVYPNNIQDDLVLWYDFSTKSNNSVNKEIIEDLSGNHNHGNLNGFKFDGTDGYMNKGLMFNGEGSEVNFPKITFAADVDWTVEIMLDKSTGIKPDGYLFGDKTNDSYISFQIDERYSWLRYGRIYYMTNDYKSTQIDRNETYPPDFVHMIVSKKDGVVSVSSGDNPNVVNTTIAEHEQNFDNLGFAYMYSHSLDNAFKGLIHSVRVYDRALTNKELQLNYELDKERFNL